jgi:SAM-dependent MidA family methyltransferase
MLDLLRNLLKDSDLPFRDFVEVALYHPELGYYAQSRSPIGKDADYVTSPVISPVFGASLSRLIGELLSRSGAAVCSIVDIGCGDGRLINTLYAEHPRLRFFGVDRSLDRAPGGPATFVRDLAAVERNGVQLVICNELFDALPFARLVMRDEHLHELWVTERDGALDWTEHEAGAEYDDYFRARGIELEDGQFADVSLEWEALYADICRFVTNGLIVTFDYGAAGSRLFRGRARRFGTAAAYAGQRVSRDLLANPGEQDITAHINFTDLERAGGREGFSTLFFDAQAKFLLSLGALEIRKQKAESRNESASMEELLQFRQENEDAKRLLLPDGIGIDIRVLVQGRGLPADGWSFQRKLF